MAKFEINPFASAKELKQAFRKYGKRALARIRTLEKYFGKGGEFYGRKNYILDEYRDFNTQTMGLSEKALRLKLQTAFNILSAKTSTITGLREVNQKRYETFMKNHPNVPRTTSQQEYETAMMIYDKLKQAEKESKFGYEEIMFTAFNLADMGEIHYKGKTISIDDIITNVADDTEIELVLPFKTHDYFASLPVRKTSGFLAVK